MLVPAQLHTFAQHPAEGELLLRDEDILQLFLQFVADAQAIHCRRGGERSSAVARTTLQPAVSTQLSALSTEPAFPTLW